MRLIDADALIRFLQDSTYKNGERVYNFALQEIIDCMPTFPVATVTHGWWIPVDSYSAFGGDEATWYAHGNPTAFHYCSECKEQSRLDEFGNEMLSKYCPDCGAKMGNPETED